jgi:hypothetical protein
MEPTDGVVHLIELADGFGTGGQSVSVRVLGRSQPGILTGHDFLDCEIVVRAESGTVTFPVTLLPGDLEDWETVLAALEAGRPAAWLESGRTPSMTFRPTRSGALRVSVHDDVSSGMSVTVTLLVPSRPWVGDQRGLLAKVHEVYPREVIQTSPGAYEWRRAAAPGGRAVR